MTTDQNESINYWELGFELFKREPELLLVEVWQRTVYMVKENQEFVAGYVAARRQKDDYRSEHE